VDKIVGPGNAYVNEAKLEVSRDVPIDLPGGPSEVVVLGDGDPRLVELELAAQREHGHAAVCTTVATLAEAEAIAPEHLVLLGDAEQYAGRVRNAGSVFVGPWSPVPAGDYATGGNHVLPTNGWARSVGGLGLETFLKPITIQRLTEAGLARIRPTVEALAAASPGDVIVEWQGLGYNRRALNLHRAAQSVAEHGWPDDLTTLPGVGPYTAGAVGNFAFGRDVLPIDVNVRRIQERSGEQFDASCTQALFDLGATICVARIPRCGACPLAADCPSRGQRYEPLRKQSKFEGSFRQRRANALRAVAAGEQPVDGDALVSLERDGLVVLSDGVASLPN
jgi:A/G-specific adenine glycosylase